MVAVIITSIFSIVDISFPLGPSCANESASGGELGNISLQSYNNNDDDDYNNKLQLGCHPVAVVI